MRIWITGGAGFLGKRLAQAFSNSEWETVSLSRRESADANQTYALNLATDTLQLKVLAASLTPDVVIHCASKQPGVGTFSEFVESNVLTTANLIDNLRSAPPRQIIFTSTLSVYSQTNNLPVKEDYPTAVANPYGATKRWAEQLLETFPQSQVTVLRLPSMYGAGSADSFVDGLTRLAQRNEPIELFSRGTVIRDALHVKDVIKAIDRCVREPSKDRFSIMNLGCGRPIRSREYAEVIVDTLQSTSPIVQSDRPASQFDCYADIKLARREIGFVPTELKESIRNYTDELRS